MSPGAGRQWRTGSAGESNLRGCAEAAAGAMAPVYVTDTGEPFVSASPTWHDR